MRQLCVGISIILMSANCFSQEQDLDFDLVINPVLDFAPETIKLIQRIEFSQDSTSNFNHYHKVYAEITKADGFNKLYSIGPVKAYQTSETGIRYIAKVTFIGGEVYKCPYSVELKDLIIPTDELEYDYADYDTTNKD